MITYRKNSNFKVLRIAISSNKDLNRNITFSVEYAIHAALGIEFGEEHEFNYDIVDMSYLYTDSLNEEHYLVNIALLSPTGSI